MGQIRRIVFIFVIVFVVVVLVLLYLQYFLRVFLPYSARMALLHEGPFIFYEHGGAGGIWLIATTKLYDPPLACNFFQHGPPPPPSRTIFF